LIVMPWLDGEGTTRTTRTRPVFVKKRPVAAAGSIPEALDMFRNEVRFYRSVAPVVGVRVPACAAAVEGPDGTELVLEDLSAWAQGGDPVAVARVLRALHDRFSGRTHEWPWLRTAGVGAELIAALYDRTWPTIADRTSGAVRRLGSSLVGAVVAAERAEGGAGPITLVHGDAALRNVRTSTDGEIALLDWEDVRAASGEVDLAWLLLSSVAPTRWDEVIAAYGTTTDALTPVLPSAAAQALLSMADADDITPWLAALEATAEVLRV
jgi:hypothetical protein